MSFSLLKDFSLQMTRAVGLCNGGPGAPCTGTASYEAVGLCGSGPGAPCTGRGKQVFASHPCADATAHRWGVQGLEETRSPSDLWPCTCPQLRISHRTQLTSGPVITSPVRQASQHLAVITSRQSPGLPRLCRCVPNPCRKLLATAWCGAGAHCHPLDGVERLS